MAGGSAELAVFLGGGIAAFAVTAALMRPLVAVLRRRAVLDIPNERSSHKVPTPRGGGLAVSAVVILGWGLLVAGFGASFGGGAGGGAYTPMAFTVLAGAVALAALSWIDDRVNLPRRLRFTVHVVAVAAALAALPEGATVFQGVLPPWADRLVAALGWVWFVNLYNFMDGIDGISGAQTASLGIGVAVLALFFGVGHGTGLPLIGMGFAAAGAAAGFLLWNWHPAKVFLGDVGSIPLGFLMGWLLVLVAVSGHLAPALILPAYYLADATLTLAARALAGRPVLAPHREHFYQRAVHKGGLRHDTVVRLVVAGNLVLLVAAGVAAKASVGIGAALAVAVVAALLLRFRRPAPSFVGE